MHAKPRSGFSTFCSDTKERGDGRRSLDSLAGSHESLSSVITTGEKTSYSCNDRFNYRTFNPTTFSPLCLLSSPPPLLPILRWFSLLCATKWIWFRRRHHRPDPLAINRFFPQPRQINKTISVIAASYANLRSTGLRTPGSWRRFNGFLFYRGFSRQAHGLSILPFVVWSEPREESVDYLFRAI